MEHLEYTVVIWSCIVISNVYTAANKNLIAVVWALLGVGVIFLRRV